MLGREDEWVTVASWLRMLEGEVIEADATMQIRQRLAWREFQRSVEGFVSVDLAEGIDRDRNLGIHEIRLRARLERLPSGIVARSMRAIRRWFGLPVPPANAFRVPKSSAHPERWIDITMTVSRERDGVWRSVSVSAPEIPLESSYVAQPIA